MADNYTGRDAADQAIAKYGYQPKYTGATEASLFDLFQRLTGQGKYAGSGNGDLNAIPFDLGKDTTGLYDALTRQIKQDYLGTPGGPQGGSIADSQAYFNNLGIPEQAANQTRLGYQDLNNKLVDSAATLNENTKNRLASLLGIGYSGGQNLYSQDLAQTRANTNTFMQGAMSDVATQNAINESNQSNLTSLLMGAGKLGVGLYTGNPALIAGGGLETYNNLNKSNNKSSGSTSSIAKLLG